MSKIILFIIIISSYLMGSINFGYLIVKIKTGKNIKNLGSGNMGATNVTRIIGRKWGILTFLLDGAKILLAAKISESFGDGDKLVLISSYSAILGHIFPIWFNFKGGKGVATSITIIFYLMPQAGFLLIINWVIIFIWKKISSLSAIISFGFLPIFSLILNYNLDKIIFSFAVTILIIYAHRSNIRRLMEGKETNFKSRGA